MTEKRCNIQIFVVTMTEKHCNTNICCYNGWDMFFVYADFPDDFPDDSPDDFPHDFPLRRMAALPRWSRMPILLHRLEMASPSSCPVCLARPPKVSATRARKQCPVSNTTPLPHSLSGHRHGSEHYQLFVQLLAWWQPGGE